MFAICIESSHRRGLGHLYRSLTLAEGMRSAGLPMLFLVNDHASSIELLRASGHEVDVVDLNAATGWETEWLSRHRQIRVWINDRLDTGHSHASRVKEAGCRLVTFDDKGDGAHLADLHIAAMAFEGIDGIAGRQVLHGPSYLILDPALERLKRTRDRQAPILLTMGGADTWGVTPRVMLELARHGCQATVVLGPAFAHHDAVNAVLEASAHDLFKVHRAGVPSLAEEMARHELAVTGGGMTPFEANAMGLPCIIIANEPHEVPSSLALERMGGAIFAGFHADMDLSAIGRTLPIDAMSRAGMQAIDLQGRNRVIAALCGLILDQQ